jgi:hypothetical protein
MAFRSFRVPLTRALATGALLCGGAGVAGAQGIGGPSSLNPMQGGAPSFAGEQLDRSLRAQPRPPAALPGAAPKAQAIAPPTQVPALMSPTDELFDAINRGDMGNVRDALSRGADLSATNELGLKPLDLSIDLGRNDISFLLLSMRGEDSDRGSRLSGRSPAPAGKSAPPAPTGRQAGRSSAPSKATTANGSAQPAKPVSTPKLFANDGGAPLPNAGFLGFDNRR